MIDTSIVQPDVQVLRSETILPASVGVDSLDQTCLFSKWKQGVYKKVIMHTKSVLFRKFFSKIFAANKLGQVRVKWRFIRWFSLWVAKFPLGGIPR